MALLSVVAAVLTSILIQALRARLGKGWLLLIDLAFGAALITLGVLLDRRQKLSVRGPKAQGVPPT